MADPAGHPPDGGGDHHHSQVLPAVAGEGVGSVQGNLLPVPGKGGQGCMELRQAQGTVCYKVRIVISFR